MRTYADVYFNLFPEGFWGNLDYPLGICRQYVFINDTFDGDHPRSICKFDGSCAECWNEPYKEE